MAFWHGGICISSLALSSPMDVTTLLPMSPLPEGPARLQQLSWIQQPSLAPGPHPFAASRDQQQPAPLGEGGGTRGWLLRELGVQGAPHSGLGCSPSTWVLMDVPAPPHGLGRLTGICDRSPLLEEGTQLPPRWH